MATEKHGERYSVKFGKTPGGRRYSTTRFASGAKSTKVTDGDTTWLKTTKRPEHGAPGRKKSTVTESNKWSPDRKVVKKGPTKKAK